MRVRIRKRSAGILDRTRLSDFIPGVVYDVTWSLGNFLISAGLAEELPMNDSARHIPLDNSELYNHVMGGVTLDKAADKNGRPPKRRRRKKRS